LPKHIKYKDINTIVIIIEQRSVNLRLKQIDFNKIIVYFSYIVIPAKAGINKVYVCSDVATVKQDLRNTTSLLSHSAKYPGPIPPLLSGEGARLETSSIEG
jgi:hypothetical protein